MLAALPGCLAVDRSQQFKGLDGLLSGDALLRTARADLGIFALLVDASMRSVFTRTAYAFRSRRHSANPANRWGVDAQDEAAQPFYEHHLYEHWICAMAGDGRRLCLPIATGPSPVR